MGLLVLFLADIYNRGKLFEIFKSEYPERLCRFNLTLASIIAGQSALRASITGKWARTS
jgi:hypothetical protein